MPKAEYRKTKAVNPRTEAGRKAIQQGQIVATRQRRAGQVFALMQGIEDGSLVDRINEFTTEITEALSEGQALTSEQVSTLNRLSALVM